jgi:serine/threonine protein kinase
VRLVLQFCSGGSLLKAIESAAWDTWRTATKVRLLVGVARSLEHLHASGVVHRDLAARNVLLETAASGELIAKVAAGAVRILKRNPQKIDLSRRKLGE